MKQRFALLACLIATSAACSHQNEGAKDPTYVGESNAAQDPSLTPASTEGPARETRDTAAYPSKTDTATTGNAPAASTIGTTEPAAPVTTNAPATTAPVQPDNTKVNERDRSSAALTPTDQRENKTDLDITQQIRKAVMADDSLSFTAKNVKIITAGGKVTLRGPVKTEAERNAIDAAARKAAGVTAVDNQIEVKK